MQRWVAEVETNCADPNRDKEFNEWYDKTHIPDMLEVTGMLRATRCEVVNPTQGQPKFMTIYEVETDDFNQTMAAVGEQINRVTAAGRMSDLCITAGLRIYKQIRPPFERKKEEQKGHGPLCSLFHIIACQRRKRRPVTAPSSPDSSAVR